LNWHWRGWAARRKTPLWSAIAKPIATGARAANVACICVSFGYRRVSLEELKADAIIDDYAEFAAAAKAIKPGLFDALSLE
jgi:hypothetical protein